MTMGKNRSSATLAILMLMIATLGCSNIIGWAMFTNTKWRADKIDPQGGSVRLEFQSVQKARITFLDGTGREITSEIAEWSNDYKWVTMTLGKGRYLGEIRGNVIEGSLMLAGTDLRMPLTFIKE